MPKSKQVASPITKYVVVIYGTMVQYFHCDTMEEVDLVTKTFEKKEYVIYSEIQLYK